MALCLLLGTFTHPFIPSNLGKDIGLIIAAIGFIGVSRTLMRTSNDQFAPPPMGRAART